jgi:hypothetical protein
MGTTFVRYMVVAFEARTDLVSFGGTRELGFASIGAGRRIFEPAAFLRQQYLELAVALFIRADIATMIRPSLPDVWIESVPP